VDYVIVVGGKNSSNTKHLAELVHHYGKPVQFVETASELDLSVYSGQGTIGVLAGASTPTWLVDEVVAVLEQLGQGPSRLTRFLRAAYGTPLVLAVGAAFMTSGIHHLLGLPSELRYALVVGAYAMAMFMLNPFLDPLGLGARGPARKRFLERNRKILVSTGALCLIAALCVSAILGLGSLLMVLLASVLGLTYKRGFTLGKVRLTLKAIPASKDILVAVALALLAVAVPLWHFGREWDARAWSGVMLAVAVVFARTTLNDLREMQNDQILGKETMPILIGRRATKIVLLSLLALALIGSLWLTPFSTFRHPWLAVSLLVACTTYPLLYLWCFHERFSMGTRHIQPPVELAFYLAGLLVLV
jgi:4-hydroxy-3-methylbut-2-enyl diphosphate reductase